MERQFAAAPLPADSRTARRPRSMTYWARQAHRYLGVLIGIQFVLWTVGGLYFSWTDLDEVHGDHLRSAPSFLDGDIDLASPAAAIAAIREQSAVDSIASIVLLDVLDAPVYRIQYFSRDAGEVLRRTQLADASTASLRPELSREEAVRMAERIFVGRAPTASIERLTEGNVGTHHEYREQPLPAWAVRFGHPENATVYVSAEMGVVQSVRNDRWRVFDFLWMLHTMDYRGRDDINNVVLRIFSILGLVTITSGFVLFALTSRRLRSWTTHRRRTA